MSEPELDRAVRWFERAPVGRDDLVVIGAAGTAWVAAWWTPGVPVLVAGAVVVAGVAIRRPMLWLAVVFVVVDVASVRASAGLDPVEDGPFDAAVTLITDPEPTSDGRLRLEVDSPVGHLLVDVRNPTATAAMVDLSAGDRAVVVGRTAPFERSSEWLVSRHLVGRLVVESVVTTGPGPPAYRAATGYRRLLDRGSESLSDDHRALLAGLVLGDDRAQPPELTADFRAAGLTHLLAVSGQNLAFVVVVFGPLVRRLRLWPRFVVSVAAVAAFALVTRFEPSVLRAGFVAVVALFAHTTGRTSGGVRHLGIAVVVLVVVDPLLVHSLGFRLSVAASVGVLVLGPAIMARLPGPTWFREGLGVTTAAQLAVAPVLIPVLGPMPLAALPANVAAGPVAGALMVWGLVAGTVAGVVGGPVAALVHVPSTAGLAVLETIATTGASLPLGEVDLRHVALVAVVAGLARIARATSHRLWGAVGALAVIVAITPIVTPRALGARPAGYDATVWVDGPVAVVDIGARASPVEVMATLRAERVAAVALVVVRSSRASTFAVVDAIEARFTVGAVVAPLAPPGRDDVVVPTAPVRIRAARFAVAIDGVGPPMRVRIGWRSDSG